MEIYDHYTRSSKICGKTGTRSCRAPTCSSSSCNSSGAPKDGAQEDDLTSLFYLINRVGSVVQGALQLGERTRDEELPETGLAGPVQVDDQLDVQVREQGGSRVQDGLLQPAVRQP